MIKTFKDKETEKIFEVELSSKFPNEIQKRALTKLVFINIATKLEDLFIPPSNRLEKLFGNRAGQYSIRINNKYRICFEWRSNNAFNVEIVDYH